MNALASLTDKLKSTGLYKLGGNILVDAELAAYAAGLNILYDALEELEREMFIQTAFDYGLTLREQAFGPKRTDLPVGDRRSMLLCRGSVTVNDYTRESIERAMLASGIRTSVSEKIAEKKLYVNFIESLIDSRPQTEIIAATNEFLPAHLVCEFDFGSLSWNYLDGLNKTFDALEAADLTWDAVDQHA